MFWDTYSYIRVLKLYFLNMFFNIYFSYYSNVSRKALAALCFPTCIVVPNHLLNMNLCFVNFLVERGRWLVLIDAAKGCATEPPDLSRYPADFVALSFYKVFIQLLLVMFIDEC